MQRLTVTLEQVKETKGTYRFDNPLTDATVTNVYVRKSAFGDAPAPRRTQEQNPGELGDVLQRAGAIGAAQHVAD